MILYALERDMIIGLEKGKFLIPCRLDNIDDKEGF
jgi:hypothetical protein